MSTKRLSQRAYARHRNCSLATVQRAIASGKITLSGDGTIDPAKADRQWSQATDPDRALEAAIRNPDGDEKLDPVMLRDVQAIRRTRHRRLDVQAERAEMDLADEKANLIDANAAAEHFDVLAAEVTDAWRAWPRRVAPEMAAELGVDPDKFLAILEPMAHELLERIAHKPGRGREIIDRIVAEERRERKRR